MVEEPATTDGYATAAPQEGVEIWRPSPERLSRTNLAGFESWLREEMGLRFTDYEALWRWSVNDPEAFWGAIWRRYAVMSTTPYEQVVSGRMPDCRWFEGSQVNYAEHVLRPATAGPGERPALRHASETRPLTTISWSALAGQVRTLAQALRGLGLKPGDRVVSYMPNAPETVVAMLATTAIGAVWSAAAPEFGARMVVDRFDQIAPKLMFAADGYTFGGRQFDRRGEIGAIVADLPSLRFLVWLPYLDLEPIETPNVRALDYAALASGHDPGPEAFRFERVAHDHPLWILFSSGTTGRPKAIVHSHIGVVAELLKYMHLHLDLGPRSCMFFYTTTGWMIWNSVVSSLMAGGCAVLYDGHPTHGGADKLWRLADEAGVSLFGASPTLVQGMKAAGVRPRERFALDHLESVILSGSPSSPETFQWFYADVKPDLWVTSQSGGTEFCSGLVGGVASRPVYAGEIQGRMLGMDVHAWDDQGGDLTGEVGELVVLKPCPSMPLRLWGDEDGARYRETYFTPWSGVWRHGDLIKVNERGGCFIYGRSDSTLNRYGVRIGTAEIYGVLEQIPGVSDSLVVCCELPGGRYFMPLFVVPADGAELDGVLDDEIRAQLRRQASPRHVPDAIFQAPAIPYTLTGKKLEVPVRRLLMGAAPEGVASRDAMRDPEAFTWFVDFANRPEVAAMRRQ